MIWFIAEDRYWYQHKIDIKQEYKLDEIMIMPDKEIIISKLEMDQKFGVISPVEPSKEFGDMFVIKELKNKHGVLSSQENDIGISEREALMRKLGLNIVYPNVTFENIGGADALKEWARDADRAMKRGYFIKPVFLLGIPGVGKSYFVEAYAGEKKVAMIEMNLPLILENPNPIRMLHNIFKYLTETNIKCVLRIDEIEHMLENRILLGQMLTILNDLNQGDDKYKLNGILFATSNNISDIIKEFPQFFRHGRWNEKFFVNFPRKQEMLSIMRYYSNYYNLDFDDDMLELIYAKADTKYKSVNYNESRSVYVPAEINYLFERLSLKEEITFDIIDEEINNVKPQQLTAAEGIAQMISRTEDISFKEI